MNLTSTRRNWPTGRGFERFALPVNPVRRTDKRREEYSKPPETFTAEQILVVARAAREGKHVNGGRRWASTEEDTEQAVVSLLVCRRRM